MKKYNVDIVGIGDPFLDLVTHIEMLPKSNTNCKMQSHCFQGGGVVATALVAAARLGLKATLVGSVGDDLFGKLSLSDLKYNNVDVSFMKVAEGKKSNFSVCLTEQAIGGKEFIVYTGNADEVSPNELDEELIKSAKIVHCGLMNDTAIKACELVHSVGGKVSIDAPYFREHVYNNYKHYDIFICSEMYYDQMCKELNLDATTYEQNLKLIQAQGPDIVIATFGEKGSKGVYGENYLDVPAYSVKAVDTTGAGDTFNGVLAVCIANGLDLQTACKRANIASAIKVERKYILNSIPTREEIEDYMERKNG